MNRQHIFDLLRERKASSVLGNSTSLAPAELKWV
jgi:hypothetical protein